MSFLRREGKSDSAVAKREIQDLLREYVILRDGGCFLRNYYEVAGRCGGWRNDGELILQADHLNSRAHSVSYADTRNVLCLCRHHHGNWKKENPGPYMMLARRYVVENFGEAHWAWVERVMLDRKPYSMGAYEWGKCILALRQDISTLKKLHHGS